VTVVWLDDYMSWVSTLTGWAESRVPRKLAKFVHSSGTAIDEGRYPFHYTLPPLALKEKWEAKVGGTCRACGRQSTTLMVCTWCKNNRYCNRACQKNDWREHRMNCMDPGETQLGVRLPMVAVPLGAPLPRLFQGGEHMRFGYFGPLLADLHPGEEWRRLFRKLRVDGRVATNDPRPGARLRGVDGLSTVKAVSVPFDEWAGGTRQGLVIPSLEAIRSLAGIRLRECSAAHGRARQAYEVELDPGMMFVSGWMMTVHSLRLDMTADRAARWVPSVAASIRRYPLDVVE
jgi:hypothetical protein